MKGLNKAIIIISKIVEVFCWIGTGFLAVMTAVVAIGREELLRFLCSIDGTTAEVDFFDVSISIMDENGKQIAAAMIVAFIGALIACVLTAMIFRNLNLIFKTAEGKTKFSKGATPFQPDNIRMVREIGIFLIAIPIVEVIVSTIAQIIVGTNIDADFNMINILMGLVVLALSQYFAYGMELQNEVDGLL